jgi:NAD(P)-dependent dehydrogenase (short-subunit alcohol dehydrogenase family)
MRLADKVALVTGSGQGIGKAMAERMALEGAAVIVNGRDAQRIQGVVAGITRNGGTALGIPADVTRRSDVRDLVEAALKAYGRIDILVNNAVARRRAASFFDLTDEDWDVVLATGVKGVFNCIQAVARPMMNRRYGKIINISSPSGMGASDSPTECNANYAAAKAAVNQLTKTFARALGPYGINVNSLAPGSIVTAESFTKRSREDAEKHDAERRKLAVLGRRGEPGEIASVAVFLASDESSFISGQVLLADGGRSDYL